MKKILFVLLLGFVSLGIVKNSYAVSDKVVTIDSSNYSTATNICESDCSDYSYLFVSVSYPESGFNSSANNQIGLSFRFNTPLGVAGVEEGIHFGFINNVSYNFSSFRYFPIRIRYTQTYTPDNFYSGGGSIVFTLSENAPSSGGSTPCPEPEPCDCDDIFIVGLFREGFWGVATAIVTLIVPVLALFLVFRLVHGLIYGKGV